MKLSDIIKSLADESSTKKKSQILEMNKTNAILKKYFKSCLDPFTNYWIRINELPNQTGSYVLDLETIENVVSTLNGRVLTGNSARDFVNNILIGLTKDDQILLKNMINHDPDCKVAEGLINKCWPKLIPEFPVMLADKYNDKTAKGIPITKNGIIVQKKEDGGRVAIVVDFDGTVTVYSRNGNILEMHGVFDNAFRHFPGKVFDGELLVINDSGVQDRTTSNGIFNKAVRQTITKEEAMLFHAMLWDVIEYNRWLDGYDDTPYVNRFETLKTLINSSNDKASIIESKTVSTIDECIEFYDSMIDQGFEGAMIKIATMPWENRRSKFVLKLKETKDATLRCVGVTPHSKDSNLIGSIDCVTSCNELEVSIGSGLTDSDRKKPREYFLNNLIDMQYNMLIKGKHNKYSMFLPRYRGIRLDQDEADTLEKLL